jgi:DNA-directed RNA polymerase I, II, and III subunit RPABC1
MQTTSLEHVLIQSRSTILDLLERRGYDASPYRKLTGPELGKVLVVAVSKAPDSLNMELQAKDKSGRVALVKYVFTDIKQSVGNGKYVSDLLPTLKDPSITECIVLYMTKPDVKESVDDKESPYDKGALSAWLKEKFKIQFFPLQRLVFNPLEHVLQPKFEIVPKDQLESLKQEWKFKSLDDLPKIRFHNDMAARCLGLMPLDVVKITRPSITSGEYIEYRVCVP